MAPPMRGRCHPDRVPSASAKHSSKPEPRSGRTPPALVQTRQEVGMSLRLILHPASAMLLGAVLFLPGCGSSDAGAQGSAPPIPLVGVAPPERSSVQDRLIYTGRIEPSQRVEIRSRVSGHLQSIHFRDGQRVHAGTPLLIIDQQPFLVARDRARANLAQARARQTLAAAQLERTTRLQQVGASSAEDLDKARGEFDGARAAVQLAQADLRSAELELSYTVVRAPISGRISDRRVHIGNYVAGGSGGGAVLTTLVADNPVKAMVEVSEADYRRLLQHSLTARVQITLEGVPGQRTGLIDFVDNEAGARTGTVRLRANIENADGEVFPGSFARVQIPVGPPQERLLVPDAAIQTDQTEKRVLVVDGKQQVVGRRIQVGGLFGDRRVVLSGLKPDDRVIVAGGQFVKPGDKVRIDAQRGRS